MSKRTYTAFRIILLGWVVLLAPRAAISAPLNVGSISEEPAQEIKKFLPFSRYLAGALKSEGIDQARVVVAKSIPDLAALLREGKVDIYLDSPFPAVAVSKLSGSKLLVRRWKKGSAEYYSVIFTHKESRIGRLEDLNGKMIAFDRPFSSSGYLLPKMALAQARVNLVPKETASSRVGASEVGYVFSNADENTMLWVLRGKVAAGAMDDQSYVSEAKGEVERLKILHRTFSMPRQILSHRGDLSPSLVARMKDLLLKMDRSEEGRRVLQEFEKTSKFDELPAESMRSLVKIGEFIALDREQR